MKVVYTSHDLRFDKMGSSLPQTYWVQKCLPPADKHNIL